MLDIGDTRFSVVVGTIAAFFPVAAPAMPRSMVSGDVVLGDVVLVSTVSRVDMVRDVVLRDMVLSTDVLRTIV